MPGSGGPGLLPGWTGSTPQFHRVLSPKKGQAVWLVLFSVKSTLRVGKIPLRGVKSGLRSGEIAVAVADYTPEKVVFRQVS